MEESGRHYVGQKTEETTKRKSVGSLHIRVGNTGTDRETGGEDADSRKELGPKNMQSNLRRYLRRKMKELKEEIGMKKHIKMKVVGSRMRWAGHVQRIGEDRLLKGALLKRAWEAEEGGRRRRPKLRWKDCVKRDLERAGTNGQEWKTIAEDIGRWRALTMKVEQATKTSDLDPTRKGANVRRRRSVLYFAGIIE